MKASPAPQPDSTSGGVAEEQEAFKRLLLLSRAYTQTGENYLAHGPKWNPSRWKPLIEKHLPGLIGWKPESGERVTRELVRNLWLEAKSPDDAVNAFFLTMVWGYGSSFRGPGNILAMLNSHEHENLGQLLLARREESTGMPSTAYYKLLASKISELGPVYASKFMYFITPDDCRVPVLDMWVTRWAQEYGLNFELKSSVKWQLNVEQLTNFTSFCQRTLNALNQLEDDKSIHPGIVDAGYIEYLIFFDAKFNAVRNDFPTWILLTPKEKRKIFD